MDKINPTEDLTLYKINSGKSIFLKMIQDATLTYQIPKNGKRSFTCTACKITKKGDNEIIAHLFYNH